MEGTLSSRPIRLFYSYAHEDGEHLEDLKAHLGNLRNQHIIEDWHDRQIIAGDNWEKEIGEFRFCSGSEGLGGGGSMGQSQGCKIESCIAGYWGSKLLGTWNRWS